jgi:hypothetical protein
MAAAQSTAIDSTYVKAQRTPFDAKGVSDPAYRSLARWLDDQDSRAYRCHRPYGLMLTAGNVSDVKVAPELLERAGLQGL